MLNKLLIATAVAICIGGSAYAQQTTTGVGTSTTAQTLTSVPTNATTVTNWYKQNVYDPSDNKIGEIADVLIDKDGKIEVFMVSVGGFLGVGTRRVVVGWSALQFAPDKGRVAITLAMDADQIRAAPDFKGPDKPVRAVSP